MVFFPCRRKKKTKQPNPNIFREISLDLCLILSSPLFIERAEGELKAKRLALPTGLQNVRKHCANRLSFRPPVYIFWGICSYDSLVERWAKLNADISRNSFFFKQLLMHLKVRKWPKIKTQTLWSALPLKDWYTRTDLPRRLAWERKAVLSSMTACSSLSAESWVLQPDEWLPGQLSGHRWLFTAHWQSEHLKGKEVENLHTWSFHIWANSFHILSFLSWPKATLCAMKSYWSRCLFFLLALSPPFENSAVSIQTERLREKEELDLND